MTQNKWVAAGRCPFTKQDSTKARFEKFLKDYPEFSDFASTQVTRTVSDRKKVIDKCQKNWRAASKRRRMSYRHMIKVSVGDLFERIFSPVNFYPGIDKLVSVNVHAAKAE